MGLLSAKWFFIVIFNFNNALNSHMSFKQQAKKNRKVNVRSTKREKASRKNEYKDKKRQNSERK